MRIGVNPAKENNLLEQKYYHRIFMPVYIPNQEEYFKDAFKILQICLQSIYSTIHQKTAITVINNGCCSPVSEYLNSEFLAGKIDTIIMHFDNKGKIDPLVGAIRGSYEPVVTITDADVLFEPGWQSATEEILFDHPRVGMVSPVPLGNTYKFNSASTIFYGLIRNRLRFERIVAPETQIAFAKSIGKESDLLTEGQLNFQLVIGLNTKKAIVGCGHFVATMRKEVFEYSPREPSNKKIVGNSETRYIDIPNDKSGLFRLATTRNYAFHMGNVYEDWMVPSTRNKIEISTSLVDFIRPSGIHILFYSVKIRVVRFLITKNRIRPIIFKWLKLDSKYIHSYHN